MFETMQKIAIALMVGAAAVGAVRDWSRDVPSVTANYYTQTRTGGEIEARYTAMGGYDVTYAEYPARDVLIKRYEIWYPSDLAQEDREWPVVVMANGTGVPATRYAPVFRHLASWGFVVIGNEMQNSWSGEASAGALDLLAELNGGPSSPFFPKLDLDNVGSAGRPPGGQGAPARGLRGPPQGGDGGRQGGARPPRPGGPRSSPFPPPRGRTSPPRT